MFWSIDLRTIIAYKHELLVDIVRTALYLLLTFSSAVAFFFLILTLLNCSFDKVVLFNSKTC